LKTYAPSSFSSLLGKKSPTRLSAAARFFPSLAWLRYLRNKTTEGGQAMSSKAITSIAPKKATAKKEYVEIKHGKNGLIKLEISAWNRTLGDYVEATLTLAPEEAHLFSKMLLRHAGAANQVTAAETAFAVSS
jgi:hypothetical protein